jgi:oligopeptidase B
LIYPNPWSTWENTLIQVFCIKTPTEVPSIIHILKDKIVEKQTPCIKEPIHFKPIETHKYIVKSNDNTDISYIVVKEKGVNPVGQIVYVYGAYGTQTPIAWTQQQWYPLLKRKWAIVYALVRGGGDKSYEWAEQARRENRHKSIEDFEAVIKASQERYKLSSHQTVLYGRSAGGIPVGAVISRNPSGKLFNAVYTESPYVDLLRTSTNPDLPLTIGEYEEFGNPKENIIEFASLLKISPIDSLPIDGAPSIFLLDRVGLKDRQVYAYESFKWIQRLRGYLEKCGKLITNPCGKYITFEEDEGHHYSSKQFVKAKATDLAILELWRKGSF